MDRLRTVILLGIFTLGGAQAAYAVGLAPAREWNAERAAHLLRRTGFGGTPAEIERFTALGVEPAVDSLVNYVAIPQTDPAFEPVRGSERHEMLKTVGGLSEDERREWLQRLQRLDRLQIEELRAWWMRRMIRTPRPFEEKMTLFWHGHFTSGHREVRNSTWMYDQNELLRTHALAPFRDLLVAISQDPAMLRYLDNASNRKSAPNENYARELLELFTLGEGNYSERDIKEAARALTGWTLRAGEFAEARMMHDRGEKTFLGRTGNLDGYDVIDTILEQPAAAQHLARRLLIFFLTDDPSADLADDFARVIRASNYDLRASMRALLASEAFYAPEYMHSKIKSPVELVVGTVRLLEIEPRDLAGMVGAARGMGQELFQPPNVKGWDGGRKWINTATVFARYNFASGLLTGTESRAAARLMAGGHTDLRMRRRDVHRDEIRRHLDEYPGLEVPDAQVTTGPQPPFDPRGIVERERLFTADKVLNHFVARILPMTIDPAQRSSLRALLMTGHARFDPRTPEGNLRTISLINALLATPEYQLN